MSISAWQSPGHALAALWLYLNPQRSRRFLAARLQARLREAGVAFTLDSLQAILAGTKSRTRRAVYDELVELLGESGVGSEGEALHNSIQPLLGGWKKRARGFVHRAMLAELAREARSVPAKCRMRSCVFPAARDGLCRQCWLAASDTTPFARRSSAALLP